MESQAKELEAEIERGNQRLEMLNRQRQADQVGGVVLSLHIVIEMSSYSCHSSFHPKTSTGTHLTALESKWQTLVSSTIQLEMANVAMESEVAQLKSRRDALVE